MGRRRLLLPTADDDDDQPPENPQPLEISDDEDFVDVPEAFSPPAPPVKIRDNPGVEIVTNPVDRFLRKFGLSLRSDWLESCLSHLSRSRPDFQLSDDAAKSKLCFEQFLFSDMNFSGAGLLPRNLSQMHGILLQGPFVLQVDETVNISSPLRERYQEIPAGPKRCLKLSMTDGSQRVYGMEYRPISQLRVLAPSGLKIMICNVHVRHGLLMLVPEIVEVLGGMAEDLEVARGRLIHEISKPPRGKRSRNEEFMPLNRRASLAAWPPMVNDGVDPGNLLNDRSGFSTISEVSIDPTNQHAPEPCVNPLTVEQSHLHSLSENTLTYPGQCINSMLTLNSNNKANVVDVDMAYDSDRTMPDSGQHAGYMLNLNLNTNASVVDVDVASDSDHTMPDSGRRRDSTLNLNSNTNAGVVDVDMGYDSKHRIPSSGQRTFSVLNSSSNNVVTLPSMDMVDDIEHRLILSEERETPFTYLACLLAKRAARDDGLPFMLGKIKCILTGVKSFQFKNRSTYELNVYIDDGSLISEILIDHLVVENGIGYSPAAVTAALSSSDKVKAFNMREIMKRFQVFLMKFEGTMIVELRKDQTTLVAVELVQGFSTSDAWPLLNRLKTFSAALR